MMIHPETIKKNTSAGELSANTEFLTGAIKSIIVRPATESTQYDVEIVDPSGISIYYRTSETGTMTELTDIPFVGIYTVSILNATKDEEFIIKLLLES